MGETLYQRLHGADILRAATDARSWGFPREVQPVELLKADWFRMGESVVFWFEHYPVSPTYFVHLAVDPEVRGRWGWAGWLRWIADYARSQGAPEVGFVPADGAERVGRALRCLGWQPTPYGLALPLEAA